MIQVSWEVYAVQKAVKGGMRPSQRSSGLHPDHKQLELDTSHEATGIYPSLLFTSPAT
jgi:hypothetical protein